MPPKRPTIRDNFGARLRALRVHAKLTQEEVAFRADMDRSYVGQVERGEVNISLDNIQKLARGLRVKPGELFEFSIGPLS